MAIEKDFEYMLARDAVNGQEGYLTVTIGEGTSAVTRVVAECKNISAKVTKNKAEFKAMGYRGVQHKAKGWSGTGSLTIYYVTSYWNRIFIEYINGGKDVYFTLNITNFDSSSMIGSQQVQLTNVNLDEIEIAKLDVDADYLENTMNFTFSGVVMSEYFDGVNDDKDKKVTESETRSNSDLSVNDDKSKLPNIGL
jgi:hypothetical protein